MKTLILAVVAVVSLSVGIARAEPASGAMAEPNGSQYNLTAGAAGWG